MGRITTGATGANNASNWKTYNLKEGLEKTDSAKQKAELHIIGSDEPIKDTKINNRFEDKREAFKEELENKTPEQTKKKTKILGRTGRVAGLLLVACLAIGVPTALQHQYKMQHPKPVTMEDQTKVKPVQIKKTPMEKVDEARNEMVQIVAKQYKEAYPDSLVNEESLGYIASNPQFLYEITDKDTGTVYYAEDLYADKLQMQERYPNAEVKVIEQDSIGSKTNYAETRGVVNNETGEILAGVCEINGQLTNIELCSVKTEQQKEYRKADQYLAMPTGMEKAYEAITQAEKVRDEADQER